jgi:hypothetical protein
VTQLLDRISAFAHLSARFQIRGIRGLVKGTWRDSLHPPMLASCAHLSIPPSYSAFHINTLGDGLPSDTVIPSPPDYIYICICVWDMFKCGFRYVHMRFVYQVVYSLCCVPAALWRPKQNAVLDLWGMLDQRNQRFVYFLNRNLYKQSFIPH